VARTEEEAERQAAGEDVTTEQQPEDEAMDLEDVFEEGASADVSEEASEEVAEEAEAVSQEASIEADGEADVEAGNDSDVDEADTEEASKD
jgi:hypothetical protein